MTMMYIQFFYNAFVLNDFLLSPSPHFLCLKKKFVLLKINSCVQI